MFTKVYRGLTMKNFKSLAIIITSASMFSCAIPQGVYKTTEGGPLHPEFPTYTSLILCFFSFSIFRTANANH